MVELQIQIAFELELFVLFDLLRRHVKEAFDSSFDLLCFDDTRLLVERVAALARLRSRVHGFHRCHFCEDEVKQSKTMK